MSRYFLELSYKGTAYSGFQAQHNANTIQAEVEKAFEILRKEKIVLTGSSRTDAGVHARQNFFHFDTAVPADRWKGMETERNFIYKMNAILPEDIVVKGLKLVPDTAHCRFDAWSREYNYYIYRQKDPFLKDRAFYFPYKLDIEKLQEAASVIMGYSDFTSFSKRNTQVKTFVCRVTESQWIIEDNCLVYKVKANRFLRGMVRALTATMLKIGRGKLTIGEFRDIVTAKDCTLASFAVPPQGLVLLSVEYPEGLF
jgi:tRNA pseudouridine38-40 synthase